jgi:hypothetical protein
MRNHHSKGYLSKSLEMTLMGFSFGYKILPGPLLVRVVVMVSKRTKVKKVPIRRAESS